MEASALEFLEMLEENCHKRSDVLGAVFGSALHMSQRLRGIPASELRHFKLTTVSPYSAYEKPTPIGWSMKKMLEYSFQE